MLTSKRAGALRREMMAARYIPCSAHVSMHVVKTTFGDYLQVFRLAGTSFESADDEQLNTWHERLNVLWRNISSPIVALWTHIVRRRDCCSLTSEPVSGFAQMLAAKFRERLAAEALMVIELFLALIYRPVVTAATGLAARVLSRAQSDGAQFEVSDSLDACAKLAQTVQASLACYEPELLGAYQVGNARCTTQQKYLGSLINGEWQRMPLLQAPLNE